MLPTLLVTGEEEEEEEQRVDSSIIDEKRSSSQLFGQEPLFALHQLHLLWVLAGDPTARSDTSTFKNAGEMGRKKNGREEKKKFLKEEGEQVSEVKRGRWRERTQRRSRKQEEGGAGILSSTASAPAGCLGRPLRTGRHLCYEPRGEKESEESVGCQSWAQRSKQRAIMRPSACKT